MGSQGSRAETNHFMFPPLGPRSAFQGVQPLDTEGSSQLPTMEEEPAQEVEHMPPASETRTFAAVPVQEDLTLMISRTSKSCLSVPLRSSLVLATASGSSEGPTSRLRLDPPPTFENKRETSRCPKLRQSRLSKLRVSRDDNTRT